MQNSIYFFNALRYSVACLVVLPFALNAGWRLEPRLLGMILLTGVVLFGGATFQQWGLAYTTAGNAGFITGLYVVLIPLISAIFLKRPPRLVIWAATAAAAAGLFLLSTAGTFRLAPGDGLELIGAFMWAAHVLLIAWLVQRVNVFQLALGQNLACAVLSLLFTVGLEDLSWHSAINLWFPILYTGVFSIGVGYTLQAFAQKEAPPSDAAIILSMEAVFAALSGWLFIEERLLPIQLLGCALMLMAMLLAQADVIRGEVEKPAAPAIG